VIVVTAAEMRALDRWTIEHGTPGHVLMERAGAGAARVLRERLRRPRGPAIVVCGRGNNGGDGFVVARHLRRARIPVEVWLVARPDEVKGDAARMLATWQRGRGRVHELTTAELQDQYPHWSPDGRQITFHRVENATNPPIMHIYKMSADGSGVARIDSMTANDFEATWSPLHQP